MLKSVKRKKNLCCNRCGKTFATDRGTVVEGIADITVEWGFFSKRDGELHRFAICEKCYDEIIEQFKLKPTKENKTELI